LTKWEIKQKKKGVDVDKLVADARETMGEGE